MAEPLETRRRRLERERDEADRRYNEALTELDRAVPPAAGPVEPAPVLDEHQLSALNQAWNILQPPAGGGGLRHTLASLGWRVLAPILHRQLTFNS